MLDDGAYLALKVGRLCQRVRSFVAADETRYEVISSCSLGGCLFIFLCFGIVIL